jgi:hypothetical protein
VRDAIVACALHLHWVQHERAHQDQHFREFRRWSGRRDLGAKGDSLSDWSTDMRRHIAFGLAGMAFLLVAAAPPAAAAEKTTVCTMDFTLKGWSAGYKTAKGEGTISCDNGQTAEVRLHAVGGGLTAGKSAVRDGRGKFTPVADVRELFGDYASAGAAAGAGPSSEVQALTKLRQVDDQQALKRNVIVK